MYNHFRAGACWGKSAGWRWGDHCVFLCADMGNSFGSYCLAFWVCSSTHCAATSHGC